MHCHIVLYCVKDAAKKLILCHEVLIVVVCVHIMMDMLHKLESDFLETSTVEALGYLMRRFYLINL